MISSSRKTPSSDPVNANFSTVVLFADEEFARAHIGAGQPPAKGLPALCGFNHYRRQPVIAARAEQAFFQN
ncbi:hypothetical protein OAK20_02060, partial [Synechococcus sp. AH-551-P21]|nr:hypothetical protein [Synechococcus sp. AH-551-P21]